MTTRAEMSQAAIAATSGLDATEVQARGRMLARAGRGHPGGNFGRGLGREGGRPHSGLHRADGRPAGPPRWRHGWGIASSRCCSTSSSC